MAHSGKTITFGTDLLPQEDNIYSLGNNEQRWKIYGDLIGGLPSNNIVPIETKTFSGFYATANNDNRKIAFFGTITRNNINIPWRIRLKIQATIPNHPDYAYTDWDIDYWGHLSTTKAQYIKVNHGTNYALYSLQIYYPKDTTDNNILIGIYIYANNNYNVEEYARTLKIDFLGSENCTFSFKDSLLYRESITTANYTGIGITLNATGYQETGDSNSTYNLGNNQLYNTIKAGEAIATERIIVGKNDNLYYELKANVSFDLTKPILWLTTALTANGTNYANIFTTVYDRNLTNVKSTFSGIANSTVYIKGTINGNIFTVDDDIIVNSLPENIDNKAYIDIGRMGNQTTGLNYFYYYGGLTPTIWEYKNGNIRIYEASQNLSEISNTDDLQAIEAVSGTGLLKRTGNNTWTLDTTSYTTNTGTVTKVSTGAGLTGGDITTTGTIKANLTSETKLTNAAADETETSGRVYPIRLDKNGKLAVNVPWTDTNKYHTSGSWSGLTYTATAVNSANELAFTIPTGTTETTVATGNHNHNSTYLKLDGSNNMTADVNIIAGDTDKFVNFWYNTNKTAGASWRIGMLGSGSSDTNYFVIESGTSTTSATTWNRAIQIGQNTYNITIKGNLQPDIENSTKTLGTSSYKWANVYATTFTGNLTGNASGTASNITGILALDNFTKGTANTALMGQGDSSNPSYVSVSPSISITAGTASDAPKINLTVLGISGTAQELTKASTSIYGVTKLYDGVNSSSTEMAATAKAVKTAYDKAVNIIAESNALVYKGSIDGSNSANNGGAYTEAANCGDVYIASTAGYVNGIYVELGDMLICNTDETAQANSSNYTTISSKWDIIQTSNGTVSTSETSVAEGEIPVFKGTTGRFIMNSEKSFTTTAPSSSSSDLTIPTSKAVWTTVNTVITGLDVTAVGGDTGEYVSQISETDGKISATISTTSVSNSWTAGTTAGPTLMTTVNGISGTAVAIPSASGTASGIITTGDQTFAGIKTFSNTSSSTSTATGAVVVSGGLGVAGQVTATRLAANGSNTNYNLYVNGTSLLNGNTTHNGIIYLANGTTYSINNSAAAYLSDLKVDKVRLDANQISFYQTENASGNRYAYIQSIQDVMTFAQENGTTNTTPTFTFNGIIKPDTDGAGSLGTSSNRWSSLYLGTANTYGSAYQPVYWNNGLPTVSYPVQYSTWSISNGHNTATLTASGVFTANTYVIALVVTSGQANLNGPITWTTAENTLTLTTSAATSGAVEGYVLTAIGTASGATCVSSSVTS